MGHHRAPLVAHPALWFDDFFEGIIDSSQPSRLFILLKHRLQGTFVLNGKLANEVVFLNIPLLHLQHLLEPFQLKPVEHLLVFFQLFVEFEFLCLETFDLAGKLLNFLLLATYKLLQMLLLLLLLLVFLELQLQTISLGLESYHQTVLTFVLTAGVSLDLLLHLLLQSFLLSL